MGKTKNIPTDDTLYNGINLYNGKNFFVNIIGKGINISHKLVFQSHLICSCEMVQCMKLFEIN